ncbi:MAG: hypothetical protein GXP42_17355, partial [Chloroflexi bacterium]|nr:hypothetical protein [Chloroflexota bacterium]
MKSVARLLRRFRWWIVFGLALLAVWFAPLKGQILVVFAPEALTHRPWPQMTFLPASSQNQLSAQVIIRDIEPWPNVLLTWNDASVRPESWERVEQDDPPWEWRWQIADPGEGGEVVFYSDCQTGCRERGRWRVGDVTAPAPEPPRVPTKLGVVFPNPQRDWRGRSGWAVELTYARLHDEPYWGVDDLAVRVAQARAQGLRVIVRVDYDQGQSLPPAGDEVALAEYLAYLQRLARDQRLSGVYALQLGSGYNTMGANRGADGPPVTPAWAARLINGYGLAPERIDNAVQAVGQARPVLRVLVGPVQPWTNDQNGDIPYTIDVPWLNYFHTLVTYVAQAAEEKSAAGQPAPLPHGFAVQAPGRPDAPELEGAERAQEPLHDLPRPAWHGAQAGFRVYRDWLAVIDSQFVTRGLPLYITSTNTYTPDDPIPPAQNYPAWWLRAA